MDHLDFKTFFYDKLKERGLTLRRLSELSGVTIEHLENLAQENFSKLPAAPYLRGYLAKLAAVLDFDPHPWWDYFERLEAMKISGPADELPKNRFAQQSIAKYAWLAFLGLAALAYFGFEFSKIIGKSPVTILSPANDSLIKITENTIDVKGNTESGVNLTINGEAISVGADGSFEKIVALQPGINTIEIAAKKFLGGETKAVRRVFYEAPPASQSSSTAPAAPPPAP